MGTALLQDSLPAPRSNAATERGSWGTAGWLRVGGMPRRRHGPPPSPLPGVARRRHRHHRPAALCLQGKAQGHEPGREAADPARHISRDEGGFPAQGGGEGTPAASWAHGASAARCGSAVLPALHAAAPASPCRRWRSWLPSAASCCRASRRCCRQVPGCAAWWCLLGVLDAAECRGCLPLRLSGNWAWSVLQARWVLLLGRSGYGCMFLQCCQCCHPARGWCCCSKRLRHPPTPPCLPPDMLPLSPTSNLQGLVDDDLVHSEKIGISNYFW